MARVEREPRLDTRVANLASSEWECGAKGTAVARNVGQLFEVMCVDVDQSQDSLWSAASRKER